MLSRPLASIVWSYLPRNIVLEMPRSLSRPDPSLAHPASLRRSGRPARELRVIVGALPSFDRQEVWIRDPLEGCSPHNSPLECLSIPPRPTDARAKEVRRRKNLRLPAIPKRCSGKRSRIGRKSGESLGISPRSSKRPETFESSQGRSDPHLPPIMHRWDEVACFQCRWDGVGRSRSGRAEIGDARPVDRDHAIDEMAERAARLEVGRRSGLGCIG